MPQRYDFTPGSWTLEPIVPPRPLPRRGLLRLRVAAKQLRRWGAGREAGR